MRERLLNEIIVALKEEQTTSKSMTKFKERVTIILNEYEISERETDIIPQGYIPKELEVYLVTRVIEGLAKSSAEDYKRILVIFFLTVKKGLRNIDSNDIRVFLYYYQKEHNISGRYLDWIRSTINAFFTWCVNNSYLDKNPASGISPIRYSYKRKESLTQEELEEIRDKCFTVRERFIVEILYSTGMRLNELCKAKIQDLNLESKSIIIYNQKGKRFKTCYLNDKAVYWTKKYLLTRKDNEYLLQGVRSPYSNITGRRLEKIVEDIKNRTSINKKVSPSTFRHTTATQGLNNGMSLVEVQTLLDHKSPTTTLIYADRYNENIQQSHRQSII